MRTETVAASFAFYRERVLPKNAPPIQIEECRRAFYSGVYFMLANLLANIGDASTTEEEGIAELEKLKAECEAFAVGVPLPRAAPPVPDVPDVHYTTKDAETMKPVLQDLGQRIGDALPEGWGFTLLLYEFGPGGSLFYISNAQRADVLASMAEFIRRQSQ